MHHKPDRDPIHKYEPKGAPYYHNETGSRLYYIGGQWVSKEWAKMFLEKWNHAVRLWNGGLLFSPEFRTLLTPFEQREYAALCVTWLIPNGMVEPHCAAYNIPADCDCYQCTERRIGKFIGEL